jgi:PAS domain S-box-containing protein
MLRRVGGEISQKRVWLAVADPALRALWVDAIAARGLLAVAPGEGEAALAVLDARALELRVRGALPAYTLGVATDAVSARRLLEAGADDACVAMTAEWIALRLEVALKVGAAPPPGPARQLAQLTAMLRGVSAAALRLRDREELLAATCRLALDHGLHDAVVFMLEPDRRTLRQVASAGKAPEEALLEVATQALGGSRPSTHDLMDAATRGDAELLALPLRRSSRPIGVLVLRVGLSMTPSFRPLLEDLAASLSLALELIDEEGARRAVVATLRSRERRQAGLAHLGARALEVSDIAALMAELTALTAETADADFCRLLRAEGDGLTLLPLATHGMPPGAPEPRAGTPGGQALVQREPVLVERYVAERRFADCGLARAGAEAGVHVVVPRPRGPWGVLEVGRRAPKRFTDDDVHFIQTCAALLGHALARFESNQALRRSEATFRTLIDAMPVAINVVEGGRYVYVNERLVQMLGFSAEQMLSMGPADLVVPTDLPQIMDRHQKALERGVPNPPVHVRARRADGSIALLESVSMGIPFDGKPAVVGIALDIGERQTLREKLVLAERLSAVGTLAAGVAHEINNPLAYVIGNLSYLEQELSALRGELPGDPVAQERAAAMAQALDEAREGAQRVRHIVGDLKTFSRTDDERRGAVDVNALVDSSVNIALAEIRHRARLVRTVGPVPPVHASPGRLGQLFLNLLVNAAQAIPEGKPNMEVRVVTRADEDGRAVVEVFDTGVGIPPEVRSRIFDPFFTTKPVGVGTGLGLSICHGIVSRLGGELQVESEVGKGSCFRVVLPAGTAAAEAPQPERAVLPGRAGRVLVIDDEPLVGAIIQRALTPPHTVVRELSAKAALLRLDAGERFDLILCDLLMPGLTGMDLHAELTARHPEQTERLLFLSGGAFTPRAQAFLEDPSHVCLEKPFDVDRLRAVVRERLERLPPA